MPNLHYVRAAFQRRPLERGSESAFDVLARAKALADYLLETAGVAALGGGCFGRYGQGYLRFSYANSVKNIERGLERITEAVEQL
jgi:aspartate/methionine/tyrosine aminotransferase